MQSERFRHTYAYAHLQSWIRTHTHTPTRRVLAVTSARPRHSHTYTHLYPFRQTHTRVRTCAHGAQCGKRATSTHPRVYTPTLIYTYAHAHARARARCSLYGMSKVDMHTLTHTSNHECILIHTHPCVGCCSVVQCAAVCCSVL